MSGGWLRCHWSPQKFDWHPQVLVAALTKHHNCQSDVLVCCHFLYLLIIYYLQASLVLLVKKAKLKGCFLSKLSQKLTHWLQSIKAHLSFDVTGQLGHFELETCYDLNPFHLCHMLCQIVDTLQYICLTTLLVQIWLFPPRQKKTYKPLLKVLRKDALWALTKPLDWPTSFKVFVGSAISDWI